MADRGLLAHLFRRAGFGARPEELTYYASRNYLEAVDDLVSGRPLMGRTSTPLPDTPSRLAPRTLPELQAAWFERMLAAPNPLVERMVLFLHDHFATTFAPDMMLETPELAEQQKTFRTHALGSWTRLGHAMLDDVALTISLDLLDSSKGKTNENFAREMLELFFVGIGHYTEFDVREAARALTGVVKVSSSDPLGPRFKLSFDPNRHDSTIKTILGRQGPWKPHDAVDIALSHPNAKKHLATKLVAAFVDPVPPATLVDRVATALASNQWSLSAALRTIFVSGEFCGLANRRAVVRTPVEFAVSAQRALGRADTTWCRYTSALAGQSLFQPPNVGGWTSGDGWLQTAYLLARYNAADELGRAHVQAPTQTSPTMSTPAAYVRSWTEVFGMTELTDTTRAALERYVASAATFLPTVRDAGLITLLVASPEFSLA